MVLRLCMNGGVYLSTILKQVMAQGALANLGGWGKGNPRIPRYGGPAYLKQFTTNLQR